MNIPIAGVGLTDRLSFVDEFHLNADGIKVLSQAVGDSIEPLLAGVVPAGKSPTKSKKFA